MSGNIKLGQINFTNCLPINYSFSQWGLDHIEVYDGCPSEINRMMKDEIIHIAPVSSIEYLKNQDKYTLIDNICISSTGKVGSVILFSNYEINNLSNKRIALPYSSASSIAALKVLLKKFGNDLSSINFKVHQYETSLDGSLNNNFDAILYIGDPALIANSTPRNKCLVYDLGESWLNLTGLPMVFGTWVANTAWRVKNKEDFIEIKNLLYKAVESGLNIYFNDVIKIGEQSLKIDKSIISDYLKNKINYKFTTDHMKSLTLFKKLNDNLKSEM